MQSFYFTYGTDGTQPFRGGWTQVKAESLEQACALFRAVHPDKTPGLLNCAGVYTEEQFRSGGMGGKGDNLGRGCVEIIRITITRL